MDKQHSGGNSKTGSNKLKLLYLAKIFTDKTDEDHMIDLASIQKELGRYGISVERKTIYSDIEELRRFGLDILMIQKSKNYYYYLAHRDFELPEVKLLVDSVLSANFITEKKSKSLVKKLGTLAGVNAGKAIQRQVYIEGRVKTMNESIYYTVDAIHNAIGMDTQIRFIYTQWNLKKKLEPRHNGEFIEVSPWTLLCDRDNYYLVAYDPKDGIIKHYRVDKMIKIDTVDRKREGRELFEALDIAEYTKKMFSMYQGSYTTVTLRVENEFIGVIIDKFGKDIPITIVDDDHFETRVTVSVSGPFYGWVLSLGSCIKIVSPKSIAKDMRDYIKGIYDLYSEDAL